MESVSPIPKTASFHTGGYHASEALYEEPANFSTENAAWLTKCFPTMFKYPPGVQFLPLLKLGMVVHACNPSSGDLGASGSKVQGYPWPHIELDASLGSTRLCHKENKNDHHNKKVVCQSSGSQEKTTFLLGAGKNEICLAIPPPSKQRCRIPS